MTDYKAKSIATFNLKPLPFETKLDTPCDNNEVWKAYYDYRKKQKPSVAQAMKKEKPQKKRARREGADEGGDDEEGDDEVDPQDDKGFEGFGDEDCELLLRHTTRAFARIAATIGQAGSDLLPHTSIRAGGQLEEPWEVRSADYSTVVCSPYEIPHAVEMLHDYHSRSRMSSCEFSAEWSFKLIRFDGGARGGGGEAAGDKRQQELAEQFPKERALPMYSSSTGMESLCSNELLDCPDVPEDLWVAVQNINVENLNTCTLRRIREWLYGAPGYKSVSIISDFDLLRLLFASMGTPGFQCLKGDVGYKHEEMKVERVEQLVRDGVIDEGDWPQLNWLQYQARLISGALRPQDTLYEPYDQRAAKAEWGRQLLEMRAEFGDEEEDDEEEDDEDEDESGRNVRNPWLLWEESCVASRGLYEKTMRRSGPRR